MLDRDEETWIDRDMVLLMNNNNTMARTCEQWRNVNENRKNKETYTYNQKERNEVSRIQNVERWPREFNTYRTCWSQEKQGEWSSNLLKKWMDDRKEIKRKV